jgi:hypothetical protein
MVYRSVAEMFVTGILQKLLDISPIEATFARRKFHFAAEATREHLEHIGATFLHGYRLAIEDPRIEWLTQQLNDVDLESRGYGFEGAAMALDLLDNLQPWNACRIRKFLRGPAQQHLYMVHVGVGWSMARMQLRLTQRFAHLDPLLRWLALDGFGFHEGYFYWSRYSSGARPALSLFNGYGQRVFDQGLGRSLWFVGGADPNYILSAIMHFPETRHDDLWSGIGLACTYAGGANTSVINMLRSVSGQHWPHLGQGAVFAAGARRRAGNIAAHTELACQLLVGKDPVQASALCDEVLSNAVEDTEPAYEVWRRRIREHLRKEDSQQSVPSDVVGAELS